MKVTIIGSGNVAEYLCNWYDMFKQPICQVAGRNKKTVSALARKYHVPQALSAGKLLPHNGIYIIAVNDDEIENAFKQWYNGKGTWVHTSGSTDLKVFGNRPGSFGVLYPLLTLKRESVYSLLLKIPFVVEANDKKTLLKLKSFILKTKGEFWQADSDKRLKLHFTAVFMNNFIHHLGILSFKMIKELKLNVEMFRPLVYVTMMNLLSKDREKLQTGPARRKDMKTIKKHLAMLKDKPELKAIYQSITNSILKTYHS